MSSLQYNVRTQVGSSKTAVVRNIDGEMVTNMVPVPVMQGAAFEPRVIDIDQATDAKPVSFKDAKSASLAFLKQFAAENAVNKIPKLDELRAFNEIGKANSGLDLTMAQIREQGKLVVANKEHDGSGPKTQNAVPVDTNKGRVV